MAPVPDDEILPQIILTLRHTSSNVSTIYEDDKMISPVYFADMLNADISYVDVVSEVECSQRHGCNNHHQLP